MVKMNENAVKEAAYYMWQNSGCPQGNDEYFWTLAVEQLYGKTSKSCTSSSCNSSKNSSKTSSKSSSSLAAKTSSTTKKSATLKSSSTATKKSAK